jgi:single-stranded-DNA-specific exonuclease
MTEKEPTWELPKTSIDKGAMLLMQDHPMPIHFARVLMRRNIVTNDEVEKFINPSLSDLRDPFLMTDMHKAVERLKDALRNGERMMILGDYDVDGVCGTALFMRIMSSLGVKVGYHVPNRFKEGYGVSRDSIDRAEEFGAKLVVSVDSGITAFEEVEYARERGIDIIITDHHEPQSAVPDALAVLDPKRDNSSYPFRELAGVGVMFKFLQAVYADMDMDPTDLFDELDLVALGTAADVVPLVDENRVLTRFGIDRMRNTANTGLAALMEISGGAKGRANSSNIIYSLAPRLNAPGRLSSASKTVELLISENWLQALRIAEEIEEENAVRREMNDTVYREVESLIANEDDAYNQGIVMASPNWHQGIIGITASRLVEKYYRPTVLISLENGMGKGSARSIKEFDIIGAMSECEDILENYGGHKYAVGLSIREENIAEFRDRFVSIIARELSSGIPAPSFSIDSELELSYVNDTLIRFLSKLAPFGESNPMPLFLTRNLRAVSNSRIVGRNHLKFKVTDGSRTFGAIAYNMGSLRDRVRTDAPPMEILYNVEENVWMGRTTIQLVIKAIR